MTIRISDAQLSSRHRGATLGSDRAVRLIVELARARSGIPARLSSSALATVRRSMFVEENRILSEVKAVTDSVLQLDGGASRFQRQTPLLGAIPEFDSMAVVALITALEEHFGISVHDEEISAETFETVGALADFVALKLRDGPT